MVRFGFCLLGFCTLVLVPGPSLLAKDLADYHLGDTIEEDIVTPVKLTVIDEETTRILKEREAGRVPVHMDYYTNSANEAVADFRSAFTSTRTHFLGFVQAAYGKQRLSPAEIASPRYQRMFAAFKIENTRFPVTTNLAETWLTGQSDTTFEAEIVSKLREAMEHPVRSPDTVPPEFKIGSTARLVMLAGTNEVATPQMAEDRGNTVAKTDMISYDRTRSQLEAAFPPEDHAIARYVISFVRPNCIVDEALTRELRARRTDPILAADHYQAGQVIARRGQVVDRRIMAALEQLREKTDLGRLRESLRAEQLKAAAASRQKRWLVAGASGIFLVLLFLIWRLARRKPRATLLPARIASSGVRAELPSPGDEALRAGLLSHLAGLISNLFVRRLISQRAELLDSQEKAAAEVDQLGARLEHAHSRMQDRLLAYERRIAELEKELETKDEENRELIKAELRTIRKQLEVERTRSQLGLN